jgi:hypothetical protein
MIESPFADALFLFLDHSQATAPYCASALLFLADEEVLTHYACVTESEIRVLSVDPTASNAGTTTSVPEPTSLEPTSINTSNPTTTGYSNSSAGSTNPNHTGAIAGGVVGGLLFIAAAVVGVILFLRNKKKNQRKNIRPEVSQM